MSKFANFLKVMEGILTADDNKVLAGRNANKAEAAVEQQLSAQRSELTDRNIALEEAEDALKAVKYPKTKIENGKDYIRSIRDAQARVDAAKDAVEETNNNIAYFEALQKEFVG